MKKKFNLESIEGGDRCSAAAGFITSIGLAAFAVPTPLNIAFGAVVTGAGLLSAAACYYN